jgi:hypothetical protein
MARTKNKIAPADERAVKAIELVKKQEAEKQLVAREAIAAVGFGLKEYDLFTYIQMSRNVFGLHAMTGIMGGKLLLAIKENEQHGTYMNALKEIGVPPRKAQRYMHVAKRFGKYDNLSHLNLSMLSVLEELTDPELEKLNDGGEVKGITLDAIDNMTAAEVRDKYRAAEKKIEQLKGAHRKEVEKLNEIIDDLKIRAEDPPQLTPAQKAHRLIRTTYTREYTFALSEISTGVRKAMSVLADAERTEGVGVQELNEWLTEFVPDSATIMELIGQWQAETENPGPIADNFNDIIEGKVDV